MADQDEDVIPAPNTADNDGDLEEEEIQDYRFLLTPAQTQKIPSKRGLKDFEPHGTNLQDATLAASREAMHLALSHTRTHREDNARAVYDEEGNGAWVFNSQGSWEKFVGKSRVVPGRVLETKSYDKDGVEVKREQNLRRLWLLPEEALWLLERGTLDIRYPAEEGQEEDQGLPMSLQGGYAAFIGREGDGGLMLEKFTVYQYLKRCGYIVLKARGNMYNVPRSTSAGITKAPPPISGGLWHWLFHGTPEDPTVHARNGPLIKPGLYRSYDDIYRSLCLIPFHDPRINTTVSTPSENSPLTITYHVYKSLPSFRKSAPGPPDFYISVISARDSLVPTDIELDALLQQTPFHPPNSESNLYKKLKDGYRDVILAVVDEGVVSLVDISDSGFGCERLWGRGEKRGRGGKGGKRGGSTRGRGGRGRGGG